jgi:hypothetical protein
MRGRVVTAVTITALCLLSVGGCAGAHGARPASDSGVSGTTVVDSGCPVARGSSPCPAQPLRARVTAVPMGATAAAGEVESDGEGRFRIALDPGRYVLQARNLTGAPVPRARPITVEVRSAGFVEVTIRFDSGIRTQG